jgi:hypothetical protein
MQLNLPPKLPSHTWQETLTTDYGRIDKEREAQLVLAAAKLSHAQVDPSLRSSVLEGNHVILRDERGVVCICEIDALGEMRCLDREHWPEKYRANTG